MFFEMTKYRIMRYPRGEFRTVRNEILYVILKDCFQHQEKDLKIAGSVRKL